MLERLEWIIGNDNIVKIKKTKVLIVGLGGVGGYVACALARSGIMDFVIIDNDTVDVSNLNRQIVATLSTIGKKKVDVLEEILHDINKDIKVTKYDLFLTSENISDVITSEIDFVIDACDTVKTKEAIILECLNKNISFISAMGTGNRMDPTLIRIMDIKKTANDPLAKIIRKWVKDNKINKKIPVACSIEVPIKIGNKVGSNSFVPASCGLAIASYVIRKIIDKKR